MLFLAFAVRSTFPNGWLARTGAWHAWHAWIINIFRPSIHVTCAPKTSKNHLLCHFAFHIFSWSGPYNSTSTVQPCHDPLASLCSCNLRPSNLRTKMSSCISLPCFTGTFTRKPGQFLSSKHAFLSRSFRDIFRICSLRRSHIIVLCRSMRRWFSRLWVPNSLGQQVALSPQETTRLITWESLKQK